MASVTTLSNVSRDLKLVIHIGADQRPKKRSLSVMIVLILAFTSDFARENRRLTKIVSRELDTGVKGSLYIIPDYSLFLC